MASLNRAWKTAIQKLLELKNISYCPYKNLDHLNSHQYLRFSRPFQFNHQSLSLLLTEPENYCRSLNPALQTYKPTWAEWEKRRDKHISVLPFRNFISLYPSLRMLTGCFIIVITQASHLSSCCRMQRRSQISIEGG